MPKAEIYLSESCRVLFFHGSPTVSELLSENGISLEHPCGGRGVCGHCSVWLAEGADLSEAARARPRRCLSCRTRLTGDVRIWLEEPSAARILLPSVNDSSRLPFCPDGKAPLTAVADIGTSTIALGLYGEDDPNPVYSAGTVNPQRSVAADVIGRISAALHRQGPLLQNQIWNALEQMTAQSGYRERIQSWIITGNTAMLYLLTGRDPFSIATAPFQPDHLFDETITVNQKQVYLPPCVHGFLGADFLCSILFSEMFERSQIAILCDLGTNGEMTLWKNGTLYAASAALGPALEGVGLRQGCMAVQGAIDRVIPTGNGLMISTIGNRKPIGLCGSGVIDAVSAGLVLGHIDSDGRLIHEMRLCEGISLAQADIHAVLLAKAAFRAGLERILAYSGTAVEDIQAAYLCGGFGSSMNLLSAQRIGLWPGALVPITKSLGNAALGGAAQLRVPKNRKIIRDLAKHTVHIPLGGEKGFERAFIQRMRFSSE